MPHLSVALSCAPMMVCPVVNCSFLDSMPDAAPSVLTAAVPYVSVMPLMQPPGCHCTLTAVMGPDVSLVSVKSNTLFVGLVAVVDEGGMP
jgi:hypothetical protein